MTVKMVPHIVETNLVNLPPETFANKGIKRKKMHQDKVEEANNWKDADTHCPKRIHSRIKEEIGIHLQPSGTVNGLKMDIGGDEKALKQGIDPGHNALDFQDVDTYPLLHEIVLESETSVDLSEYAWANALDLGQFSWPQNDSEDVFQPGGGFKPPVNTFEDFSGSEPVESTAEKKIHINTAHPADPADEATSSQNANSKESRGLSVSHLPTPVTINRSLDKMFDDSNFDPYLVLQEQDFFSDFANGYQDYHEQFSGHLDNETINSDLEDQSECFQRSATDGQKREYNRAYGVIPMWDYSISSSVDANFTAVEIISILPHWHKRYKSIAYRFVNNGVDWPLHCFIQMRFRGIEVKRNTINTQYQRVIRDNWETEEEKTWKRVKNIVPDGWNPSYMNIRGITPDRLRRNPRQGEPAPVAFVDLAQGVDLPEGDDAADLTRSIQYAKHELATKGVLLMFPTDLNAILDIIGRTAITTAHTDGEVFARYQRMKDMGESERKSRTPNRHKAATNTHNATSKGTTPIIASTTQTSDSPVSPLNDLEETTIADIHHHSIDDFDMSGYDYSFIPHNGEGDEQTEPNYQPSMHNTYLPSHKTVTTVPQHAYGFMMGGAPLESSLQNIIPQWNHSSMAFGTNGTQPLQYADAPSIPNGNIMADGYAMHPIRSSHQEQTQYGFNQAMTNSVPTLNESGNIFTSNTMPTTSDPRTIQSSFGMNMQTEGAPSEHCNSTYWSKINRFASVKDTQSARNDSPQNLYGMTPSQSSLIQTAFPNLNGSYQPTLLNNGILGQLQAGLEQMNSTSGFHDNQYIDPSLLSTPTNPALPTRTTKQLANPWSPLKSALVNSGKTACKEISTLESPDTQEIRSRVGRVNAENPMTSPLGNTASPARSSTQSIYEYDLVRNDPAPADGDLKEKAQIIRFAKHNPTFDWFWYPPHEAKIREILIQYWIDNFNIALDALDPQARLCQDYDGASAELHGEVAHKIITFVNAPMQKRIRWRLCESHARVLGHINLMRNTVEFSLEQLADLVLNTDFYADNTISAYAHLHEVVKVMKAMQAEMEFGHKRVVADKTGLAQKGGPFGTSPDIF